MFLALQQLEPTLFDYLSQISLRPSQLSVASQLSTGNDSNQARPSPGQSQLQSDSGMVITQQPTSSRSRSQSKPKKDPWEAYMATKPLAPAGKSNSSRRVAGRRHSIEVISILENFYQFQINLFHLKQFNGSIKHNALFKKRMDIQKIRSGFGPACFKLMTALSNRRFIHGKRVMDMNSKVCLI